MASVLRDVFDALTPWHLQSGRLNTNEDTELRSRRVGPPVIDTPGGASLMGNHQSGAAVKTGGISRRSGGALPYMEKSMAVPLKVVERLAGWLRAAQKASAERWTRFTVLAAKRGIPTKTEDIVQAVKENKLSTVLLLSTLAEAGFAVADMFSTEDKADPEVRKTAATLELKTLGVNVAVDDLIAANAERSIGLNPTHDGKWSETYAELVRQTCTWAQAEFRGRTAALEAHGKLQAFLELPLADVERGFRQLRV